MKTVKIPKYCKIGCPDGILEYLLDRGIACSSTHYLVNSRNKKLIMERLEDDPLKIAILKHLIKAKGRDAY